MQTDQISHLLSRDPMMCPYGVVAKDCLPEIIDTYPTAIVCNTHDADQPGEHWIAMYVDTKRRGDYFDPYGLEPQHIEFTNFMNEHCSEWAPNDRTLQLSCCFVVVTFQCMHLLACLRPIWWRTIVACLIGSVIRIKNDENDVWFIAIFLDKSG